MVAPERVNFATKCTERSVYTLVFKVTVMIALPSLSQDFNKVRA